MTALPRTFFGAMLAIGATITAICLPSAASALLVEPLPSETVVAATHLTAKRLDGNGPPENFATKPKSNATADLDAIRIPGLSEVRSNLTLPSTGSVSGAPLTWHSSDTSVITDAADGAIEAGVVARPRGGDREITLTATTGSESRDFRVRVLAAPATITTTDYVFAHFTNNEESHTDEQIYFATSADGLAWTDTRDSGRPLLTSTVGDLGVRDPYLVRSPDGDTFYLIATNLNIHDRGGWGSDLSTSGQSTSLVVWESHDLVTWSSPRLADVASPIPDAGMAWAPEAFWDATAELYYVYWATAPMDQSGSFRSGKSKIYISTTRDFVTFTDPQPWIERDEHSVIDTTMFQVGDSYYRASADAQITLEKSDSVLGQWSEVGTLRSILQDDKYDRRNFEGPELFSYNAEDVPKVKGKAMPYGLMADHPNGGDASVPEGYVPFFTSDPGSSTISDWAQAPAIDFGSLKKRHGSILPVTAAERAALEAAAASSRGSLPLSTPVDTQSLSKTWDDAAALSPGDYTPISWAGVHAALASAAAVLADPLAAQAPADVAQSALENAVHSLVAVNPESEDQVRSHLRADLAAAAALVSTETTENLPLVTTGPLHGSRLEWRSSDTAHVTGTSADYAAPTVGASDPYAGGGRLTRNAYGLGDSTSTLTATATAGSITETGVPVTVTIKERPRSAPDAGYASANFATIDGRDQEKIWISSTRQNDFFTFEVRNGGNAVITSDADTFGLRDPYLFRSHDGDKYYMIATDLNTSAGDWDTYTSHGSLKIESWESIDLVHWKRTNGDGNGGVMVNSDLAGMTWAPEAYWDDELQSYVVFFASRMYQDAAHTKVVPAADGEGYAQVLLGITRDFRTYTQPPIAWQNTGSYRIDSSVFKIGDDYYRLTKNGEPGAETIPGRSNILEKSKVLTTSVTAPSENTDPTVGWQKIDQDVLLFEGPASVKLNAGDPNQNTTDDAMILLSDLNTEHGYIPFMTSASQIAASSWSSRLSQTPGWFTPKAPGPGVTGRVSTEGLPDVRRHGAFVNVPQTVLDATHAWTGIAAVASTTTGSFDASTRTLMTTVTAADSGEVAGSVTIRSGLWTSSVALSGGSASVVLPNEVSGEVHISYDGYGDGLVSTSSAVVPEVPAGTGPSASPTAPPSGTTAPGAQPAATVSSAVVVRGGTVRVTVTGLVAGEQIKTELRSHPIEVSGIPAADQAGTTRFDVRIPRRFPLGPHTIIVRNASDEVIAQLTITVVPRGRLAVTGSDMESAAALLGAVLMSVGAGAWALRRRGSQS